jgi:hypothetical protein
MSTEVAHKTVRDFRVFMVGVSKRQRTPGFRLLSWLIL